MKTTKLFCSLFLALNACGTGLSGTWETTSAPNGLTSFQDYKQTLVIHSDGLFSRDVKAVYAPGSANAGCTVTIRFEGTWTEPKGATLRLVKKLQKNSASVGCADRNQEYVEADGEVFGSAALPEELGYVLEARTLELSLQGEPWISLQRK
ncbi:MAG: hypothetical protein IT381_24210 [Deltaproteobacteria bacterium]|nr:hypothetical protein [Deltaproteobacteria bacterium]